MFVNNLNIFENYLNSKELDLLARDPSAKELKSKAKEIFLRVALDKNIEASGNVSSVGHFFIKKSRSLYYTFCRGSSLKIIQNIATNIVVHKNTPTPKQKLMDRLQIQYQKAFDNLRLEEQEGWPIAQIIPDADTIDNLEAKLHQRIKTFLKGIQASRKLRHVEISRDIQDHFNQLFKDTGCFKKNEAIFNKKGLVDDKIEEIFRFLNAAATSSVKKGANEKSLQAIEKFYQEVKKSRLLKEMQQLEAENLLLMHHFTSLEKILEPVVPASQAQSFNTIPDYILHPENLVLRIPEDKTAEFVTNAASKLASIILDKKERDAIYNEAVSTLTNLIEKTRGQVINQKSGNHYVRFGGNLKDFIEELPKLFKHIKSDQISNNLGRMFSSHYSLPFYWIARFLNNPKAFFTELTPYMDDFYNDQLEQEGSELKYLLEIFNNSAFKVAFGALGFLDYIGAADFLERKMKNTIKNMAPLPKNLDASTLETKLVNIKADHKALLAKTRDPAEHANLEREFSSQQKTLQEEIQKMKFASPEDKAFREAQYKVLVLYMNIVKSFITQHRFIPFILSIKKFKELLQEMQAYKDSPNKTVKQKERLDKKYEDFKISLQKAIGDFLKEVENNPFEKSVLDQLRNSFKKFHIAENEKNISQKAWDELMVPVLKNCLGLPV